MGACGLSLTVKLIPPERANQLRIFKCKQNTLQHLGFINHLATVMQSLRMDDILPDDFDMTQQQADAKLIAAAPDLLQVAQHALYLIEGGFEISPAGLAELRAAIAKAGAYDR